MWVLNGAASKEKVSAVIAFMPVTFSDDWRCDQIRWYQNGSKELPGSD